MTASDRTDERFTAKEKLRLLQIAEGLSDAELGAFLRREGVSDVQLKRWRTEVEAALERPKRKRRTDRERELERAVKVLERELRRKDKALAETAALLVLKKKMQEIWGDADDDTDEETD
jgi:hypothetical protein